MIGLITFFVGALLGGFVAKWRGGNRLDIAQYAGVSGLVLTVVVMLLSVIIHRMGWS